MLLRKWFIALLTIALFTAILPAQAQDGFSDDEKALLDLVNAAQSDLQSRTAYHFVGEQTTDQTLINGVGIRAITLETELERSYEGDIAVVSDTIVNSQVEVSQRNELRLNGSTEPTILIVNIDMVTVDGAVYIRFPRVSDSLTGYPTDWVSLAESGDLAGLEAVNIDSLIELSASNVPTYELTEATVLAIEELGVDGDNRVIKVTLDAPAVLTDNIVSSLTDENVDDTLIQTLLSGATLEVLYYINAEESTLARVDTLLSLNVELAEGILTEDALSITQSTTSSVVFSDLDVAVEITVPEPAPPAEETTDETTDENTDDGADASSEG